MNSQGFKQCRLRAEFSLQDAAEALGVSPQLLMSFEEGEKDPDALTVKCMALTYNCTADELLGIAKARHLGSKRR